jgi:uncharacterized damage-inducible protein DinB
LAGERNFSVFFPFTMVVMVYPHESISQSVVPQATLGIYQHLIDTYVSETNKTAAIWHSFSIEDMTYRPHVKSSTVEEILRHQLLSERRFFGEFIGAPEPPADEVLPPTPGPEVYARRLTQLAARRLPFLAAQEEPWWLQPVDFFDTRRERIWVFWRRVLHSAHHRTQLTVYLRLLNKTVPSTYGPTADVTWTGADPTDTTDAASRK